MKRDDDLFRKILLDFESSSDSHLIVSFSMGASEEEVNYRDHCELLCDAGLLVSTSAAVYRMTNQGHDYLAAIRDDDIWLATKKIGSSVGGATVDILKNIAIELVKQKILETTGVRVN